MWWVVKSHFHVKPNCCVEVRLGFWQYFWHWVWGWWWLLSHFRVKPNCWVEDRLGFWQKKIWSKNAWNFWSKNIWRKNIFLFWSKKTEAPKKLKLEVTAKILLILRSKTFGQNWVSNNWDITDVDKWRQGICCLNKCHNYSCHLLKMVQGTYI